VSPAKALAVLGAYLPPDKVAHSVRVAGAAADESECSARDSELAVVVGLLHDVYEDSPARFPHPDMTEAEVAALELLTRADARGTMDPANYLKVYVRRIAEARGAVGRVARRVKLADARDNLRRVKDTARKFGWNAGRIASYEARCRETITTLEGVGDVPRGEATS